ncbi:hypothetical protein RJT34_30706 [Clitoria ternatea]|uniref:Uncharacterized protein n=1 Tax=Clitoria ternatea TaxID=43366 RepID=A0AAN9ETL5_CLITE
MDMAPACSRENHLLEVWHRLAMINVDGSYDPHMGRSGTGGVIQDEHRQWLGGFSKGVHADLVEEIREWFSKD